MMLSLSVAPLPAKCMNAKRVEVDRLDLTICKAAPLLTSQLHMLMALIAQEKYYTYGPTAVIVCGGTLPQAQGWPTLRGKKRGPV